jgi:hypothetical protein
MNKQGKMAILGAALFLGGIGAGRALAAQEHMAATLALLGKAEQRLQLATPDKGGHRAKALSLIQQAQAEVRAGMRFDRRN